MVFEEIGLSCVYVLMEKRCQRIKGTGLGAGGRTAGLFTGSLMTTWNDFLLDF